MKLHFQLWCINKQETQNNQPLSVVHNQRQTHTHSITWSYMVVLHVLAHLVLWCCMRQVLRCDHHCKRPGATHRSAGTGWSLPAEHWPDSPVGSWAPDPTEHALVRWAYCHLEAPQSHTETHNYIDCNYSAFVKCVTTRFKVQGSFIRHILNYTGYNQ